MSDYVLIHITELGAQFWHLLWERNVGAQDIELRLNAAHKKGYKYT